MPVAVIGSVTKKLPPDATMYEELSRLGIKF